MTFSLCIILCVFISWGYAIAEECIPSVTTVSGEYAPSMPLCSNELIFNEEFDDFDTYLWTHEERLSAVSVWI